MDVPEIQNQEFRIKNPKPRSKVWNIQNPKSKIQNHQFGC